MRLFVAIPLPVAVVRHLVEVQGRLREVFRFGGPPAGTQLNWVPDSNLHITLKFIGEMPDAQVPAICDALKQGIDCTCFALRAAALTHFPARGYINVIVASFDGDMDRAAILAGQIDKACGLANVPLERRAFAPHVTLARAHGRVHARHIAEIPGQSLNNPFPGPRFIVEEVRLMQSDVRGSPPAYMPVARFPLKFTP